MSDKKRKWKVEEETDDGEGKSYHIFQKKQKSIDKKEEK